MLILIEVFFWSAVLAIMHSYIFYPMILSVMAVRKKKNALVYKTKEEMPFISILLAVYNEEMVIKHKISSTLETHYPHSKIQFLIGSDGSTDLTDTIIEDLAKKHSEIEFFRFEERTGKPGIIKELVKKAQGEILLLTDANVYFKPETIHHLIKHFQNEQIGLVGGNILNLRFKRDGISYQEKFYIARENLIKYREGLIWGSTIGAFGGCYAMRKNLYVEVPSNFIVDDFYLTMIVLERGYQAIHELDAVCYEDVSNKVSEEFRRKVRIASGNFQTLSRFSGLLAQPFSGLSFAFFSHKVIRWFGPFFILASLLWGSILAGYFPFYKFIFAVELLLVISPIFDWILMRFNLHIAALRFLSYFIYMNFALALGFIRFVIGVRSNVWTPTERNQS